MDEAKTSLLDIKQSDLTVGDSLKVDAASAVVMTVAPLIVGVVIKGAGLAWKKFRGAEPKPSTDAPEA